MTFPAPNGNSRFHIPNVSNDTRSEWLNAARRMQSVATSKGISIITFTVVCNAAGEPVYWLPPKVRHIEPAGRADEFVELLAGLKD